MTPQAKVNPDTLVDFREVSFAVSGGRPIIDRLSLQVQSGETLVLLGESGCGKTTTLRLVNRLLTPTSGMVLVESKPTTEWDVIRLRRRGSCFRWWVWTWRGSPAAIRANCPAGNASASEWRER
jgi:ABC-type multidrug transport system fused ATPase/permease subunit